MTVPHDNSVPDTALDWHDGSFRTFVAGLPADRPVWFCFFSSGLLHVIRHFLRFVPDDLNCAFITSGLTPDEIAVRATMTDLPAFDLPERVGSHEIFEFVLRTMDRPFGLVDSDCFVMEARWFTDATDGLGNGAAVNGAFTYGSIPLAAPPFLAIDPAVRRDVEAAIGGPVSPAAYAFVPPGRHGEIDGALVRIIEPYHAAALGRVMGMEAPHLPFPQGGLMDVLDDGREARSHERFYHRESGHDVERVVFDGLMFYQLMALAAGRRIGHFRTCPGTKVFSAEAVHAGGISYWDRVAPSNLSRGRPDLPWSAHVDAVLLDDFMRQDRLPAAYAERAGRLATGLRRFDVDLTSLRRQLRGRLADAGVAVTDPRWKAVLG